VETLAVRLNDGLKLGRTRYVLPEAGGYQYGIEDIRELRRSMNFSARRRANLARLQDSSRQ